jgi:hypothetical protein
MMKCAGSYMKSRNGNCGQRIRSLQRDRSRVRPPGAGSSRERPRRVDNAVALLLPKNEEALTLEGRHEPAEWLEARHNAVGANEVAQTALDFVKRFA